MHRMHSLTLYPAQVCCGWAGDFYDALAPVRAARPVNGGTGCDAAVLAQLRALNWVFS
jgi:hypothetical protein